MRKKSIAKKDILHVIADFQQAISTNRLSIQQMYDEVRMMHFKIRPVNGDISHIDLKDKVFLEALWSLGKLDEFFKREGKKYNKREREIFFTYFDSLHDKFAKSLQKVRLEPVEEIEETSPFIEMEIFREEVRKKNIN
jgi:hypothetical protein